MTGDLWVIDRGSFASALDQPEYVTFYLKVKEKELIVTLLFKRKWSTSLDLPLKLYT